VCVCPGRLTGESGISSNQYVLRFWPLQDSCICINAIRLLYTLLVELINNY
jgi:hypothetical protein